MRLLVLAHALRTGGGRVVGTNLLNNFVSHHARHTWSIIAPDHPDYRVLRLEENNAEVHYHARRLGDLGRWVFDKFSVTRITTEFRPDVVLGLGNLGLKEPGRPQAILLHHPHLVYDSRKAGAFPIQDLAKFAILRRSFRHQLPHTPLVFCQTQTMANRLREVYNYTGRTVVTENVKSDFSALRPSKQCPKQLEPYRDRFKLFYLTRYYPHKNIEALVEMMDRSRKALPDALAVITIAPDQHPNARRLLKSIEKRGLNDRVLNVGPLKPSELADYYAACDALVMPTRLESFSGTYLEAMHFGLPILTSDLDFAREVCQDAAIYFDPLNPDDMAEKVFALRRDPKLSAMLIEKGHERLQNGFNLSWDDIAATMVNNLETIAKRDMK